MRMTMDYVDSCVLAEPVQLGFFEDSMVTEMALGLSGTITEPDAQPPRELHHGERLITVTVWHVDAVNFPTGKVGLARVHKLKAAEIHEMTDSASAERILSEMRLATRRGVEKRLGIG